MASSTTAQDISRDGYDKIAEKYLAWSRQLGDKITPRTRSLLSRLPASGAAVLDLGCGAGGPYSALLAESCALHVNDISPVQLAMAQEAVPSAVAVPGDMLALELEEASFDAVLAFNSIFHLPRGEHGRLIERMRGWTKPGGYLLFNLPTQDNEMIMDDWLGARMYMSSFDVETNKKMVAEIVDVVSAEVETDPEGRGAEFLWVLAQRPAA